MTAIINGLNAAHQLRHEQWVPRPLEEVFDFFSRPQNLQELTPAWLHFRILGVKPAGSMGKGTLIRYALRWRVFPIFWTTEILEWLPPHRFVDIQLSGPYRLWHHQHSFIREEGGTRIVDEVHYLLPFGPLGRIIHRLKVRNDVEHIFRFRAQAIRARFGG